MSFVRLMLAASLACFVALAGWMYSREALFRLSDIQVETQDVDLVDQIQKSHLLALTNLSGALRSGMAPTNGSFSSSDTTTACLLSINQSRKKES